MWKINLIKGRVKFLLMRFQSLLCLVLAFLGNHQTTNKIVSFQVSTEEKSVVAMNQL
jgi:hypothetical protein